LIGSLFLLLSALADQPRGIITSMPTRERVIALTFDACEADKVMHLDQSILDVLKRHSVPFTIFASGRFVRDNADSIAELSKIPEISIENHSWSHPRDLRALKDAAVLAEIDKAGREIERVTGRKPTLFRFPGGHANDHVVELAESMGYRVVHWRWAEGDPVRAISADQLIEQTNERTRPGDILIFHINGRGWHTAEALPAIIESLESRGYRFVTLESELEARH